MKIRNAVEEDFERFMYLVNNTYYSMSKSGSPILNKVKGSCIKYIAEDEAQIRTIFLSSLQANELIVVEDDNTVIAYAMITTKARVRKILDLMIQNEYQGKGIGTDLVTYIIKKAKKERIKKIELVGGFKGADIFWNQKMGFREKSEGLFEKIL